MKGGLKGVLKGRLKESKVEEREGIDFENTKVKGMRGREERVVFEFKKDLYCCMCRFIRESSLGLHWLNL